MKRILLVAVGWLVFNTAFSGGVDCGTSCFESEIVSAESTAEGCTTYSIVVKANGDCAHALSHYSIGIPECAEIKEVSNSSNWKIEYGTDPTSGIGGFKVDDISGFGESAGEFTVTYTLCQGGCDTDVSCIAPQVAYKAATCVYYEQIDYSCTNLEASLSSVNNSCSSGNEGSIEVNVIDGVAPFSFLPLNGAVTQNIESLQDGSYSVIITDASGETLELSSEITSPDAISIETAITNASCNSQDDGAIDATISGGVAPYTFSWSNGEVTEDLQDVKSGNYVLNVVDANGCTATSSLNIENTLFININGQVTNTSCSVNNGAIDVTVDGGQSPYSFTWSNGETSEDLSYLSKGSYNVTVTDANGCSSSRTFSVSENNPLRISASTTPTACVEDNSGAIEITIIGGQSPYTYSWSNGESTEDISGLASGIYSVTVSDGSGCSVSSSFNVGTNTFKASSMVTQPSCADSNNGRIELIISNGTAPYTYAWSNGESTSILENLQPGPYSVTIEDAAGCSNQLAYYIYAPQPLSLSFTSSNRSCTDGDFEITAAASGGTAPYTYIWDNGDSGSQIVALDSGFYSVTVTDAKGCSITAEAQASFTIVACDDGSGDDGSGDDGSGDDGSGDDGSGDDGSGDDGSGDDGSGDDGSGDDGSGDDGSGDGGSGDGGSGDDGSGDDGSGDDGSGDDGSGDDGSGDNSTECNNPFDTEIKLIEQNGDCYTYKALISYNGSHVHGLSHFTIDVSCGSIDDVSNSNGWKVVVGIDPTTGLNGIKIDDIHGFGEGNFTDEFEVEFTICSSEPACIDETNSGFTVAFKYGQCVSYEDAAVETNWSNQMDVNAYPNPFYETSTIEFYSPLSTTVKVDIMNRQGIIVKQLYNGQVNVNETKEFKFDAYGLPSDLYTYRITTQYGIKYGKILLAD